MVGHRVAAKRHAYFEPDRGARVHGDWARSPSPELMCQLWSHHGRPLVIRGAGVADQTSRVTVRPCLTSRKERRSERSAALPVPWNGSRGSRRRNEFHTAHPIGQVGVGGDHLAKSGPRDGACLVCSASRNRRSTGGRPRDGSTPGVQRTSNDGLPLRFDERGLLRPATEAYA
jgi:hypothetical protein